VKHGLLKLIKKQRTTYIDGIYGINLQAYFRKILGSVHIFRKSCYLAGTVRSLANS